MYCTNFNFLHEAAKNRIIYDMLPLVSDIAKNKLQGTDKLKLF